MCARSPWPSRGTSRCATCACSRTTSRTISRTRRRGASWTRRYTTSAWLRPPPPPTSPLRRARAGPGAGGRGAGGRGGGSKRRKGATIPAPRGVPPPDDADRIAHAIAANRTMEAFAVRVTSLMYLPSNGFAFPLDIRATPAADAALLKNTTMRFAPFDALTRQNAARGTLGADDTVWFDASVRAVVVGPARAEVLAALAPPPDDTDVPLMLADVVQRRTRAAGAGEIADMDLAHWRHLTDVAHLLHPPPAVDPLLLQEVFRAGAPAEPRAFAAITAETADAARALIGERGVCVLAPAFPAQPGALAFLAEQYGAYERVIVVADAPDDRDAACAAFPRAAVARRLSRVSETIADEADAFRVPARHLLFAYAAATAPGMVLGAAQVAALAARCGTGAADVPAAATVAGQLHPLADGALVTALPRAMAALARVFLADDPRTKVVAALAPEPALARAAAAQLRAHTLGAAPAAAVFNRTTGARFDGTAAGAFLVDAGLVARTADARLAAVRAPGHSMATTQLRAALLGLPGAALEDARPDGWVRFQLDGHRVAVAADSAGRPMVDAPFAPAELVARVRAQLAIPAEHMRRRDVRVWAREEIISRGRRATFRAAAGRDAAASDFVVRRIGHATNEQWYYFYDAAADRVLPPSDLAGVRGANDRAVAADVLAFARGAANK